MVLGLAGRTRDRRAAAGVVLARLPPRTPLRPVATTGWRLVRRSPQGRGDRPRCSPVGGALVVYFVRWVCGQLPGGRWARLALAAVVTGLATTGARGPAAALLPFHPAGRGPSLVERLEGLADRAGTRVVGVYEWALGDKSRRANAALTGLGATRRILMSDTMLADYSDDEIEVVLAHELGHHVHHDIWRGIALESASDPAGAARLPTWCVRSIGPRLGVAVSG